MKFPGLILLLCCVTGSTAARLKSNPVQKVLGMLQEVQVKIEAEAKEAQRLFEEYTRWCEKGSRNYKNEIKTGKAEVKELKASVAKETSLVQSLGMDIEELSGKVSKAESQLKSATAIRTREHADFVVEEKELQETVSMLKRAIAILEREAAKGISALQLTGASSVTAALAALVQASGFSSNDVDRLTSLLQSSDSDGDGNLGAPEADAYENHSGDIISTMESLLEKASAELEDTQKTEATAAHNYNMIKQSLEDAIKNFNEDLASTKADLAACKERKAKAEGDLAMTRKELKADQAGLAQLHQECVAHAEDYEAEKKSRAEESEAVVKAQQVISSTTGGAVSITYEEPAPSFLQLSANDGSTLTEASVEAQSKGLKVVRALRTLARQDSSQRLSLLASRVDSLVGMGVTGRADPFKKVKGLIEDMIKSLQKEQAAEQKIKAFCDVEIPATEDKKDAKESEVQKLTQKIDAATAHSAKLKEQVAQLQKELADLLASQAEMDKIRQEEHAEFVKDKPEIEEGLNGVKLGLQILREYYGQEDKDHEASGSSSGIIGLLEVIESDFSKQLAQMIADEEAAQSAYDQQTKENEIEKVTKTQDVQYKSKEAASLDKAVAEATSDRSTAQEELDALEEYYAKLQKQCVVQPDTYAEKSRRRQAEISGLKEALGYLESP